VHAPGFRSAPGDPGRVSLARRCDSVRVACAHLGSRRATARDTAAACSSLFDEHGRILGHSPQGSYTLSAFQIDHVRLTKHKVELEGLRYGLHFNEQLADEDSSTSYDKVRITPKKGRKNYH
jgi:hypothetical protein